MKLLTELDLQQALDECNTMRYRCHSDWMAGMVTRLNVVIRDEATGSIKRAGKKTPAFPRPKKTVVRVGNSTEPEVPCIK